MKKLLFPLLLVTAINTTFCQDRSLKIDSLIRIIAPQKKIDETYRSLISSSNDSIMPSELKDSLFIVMKEAYLELLDSIKVLYLKKFTDQEIDGLISFYNTSLGQKSLSLSFEYVTVLNNFSKNNLQRILKRFITAADHSATELSFKHADKYFRTKSEKFTSVEKSKKLPIELYYDENQWTSISPSEINPSAEFCIANKDLEIYAFLIPEPTVMTLSKLRQALIFNLRKNTKNLNIINEELRNINGKEILSIRLSALVNNNDLVYQWYIYCGDKGSLQYLVFTDRETYKQNLDKFENILNGLVINY